MGAWHGSLTEHLHQHDGLGVLKLPRCCMTFSKPSVPREPGSSLCQPNLQHYTASLSQTQQVTSESLRLTPPLIGRNIKDTYLICQIYVCVCMLNNDLECIILNQQPRSSSRLHKSVSSFFISSTQHRALCCIECSRSSLVAQTIKSLPSMWETWVQSLGQEDALEKGMATPLQYSCLENPLCREPWWVIVLGITKNQTRLSE